MKTIYSILTFAFFVTNVEAQIVNFPDVLLRNKLLSSSTSNSIAQNASGNNMRIDANNDGQIQVSEALLVRKLNISDSEIVNLAGLESFLYLNELDCSGNELTSVNTAPFQYLTWLDCSSNLLTALDVSTCAYLDRLFCGSNDITSLNVQNNHQITQLYCSNNELTTLDLSGVSSLYMFSCSYNNLTTLTLAGNTNMAYIGCRGNLLTSLDVTPAPNLLDLYCQDNLLTTVNANGLSKLQNLYCQNNQMTSLYVNGCIDLYDFRCQDNLLTDVVIENCPRLETYECYNNHLQYLNLQNLPHLKHVRAANNQLVSVSLSNLPWLSNLEIHNNSILESLNMYNVSLGGLLELSHRQLNYVTINQCPNLKTINLNDNFLTGNLNLTGMKSLTDFNCSNNQLSGLLLHGMQFAPWWMGGVEGGLDTVNCSNNQMTSLVIDGAANYYHTLDIDCSQNLFHSLDFSQVGKLDDLTADNNPNLEFINLKNNSPEDVLSLVNTPNLSLICQDAAGVSATQAIVNSYGYACTVSSTNCVLATEDVVADTFKVYPNPVADRLYIENAHGITSISVYDMMGKIVLRLASDQESIDVSGLMTGVYLLSITSENGTHNQRFLKK